MPKQNEGIDSVCKSETNMRADSEYISVSQNKMKNIPEMSEDESYMLGE